MQMIWMGVGMVVGIVLYRWGYGDAKNRPIRKRQHTLLQQIEQYDGNDRRKEGSRWKR